MDIPFNVTFIENPGETFEKRIECHSFYNKENEKYLVEEINLLENTNLQILFQAESGTKLYLDGLDQLEDRLVYEDKEGLYLRPSTRPYVLYNGKINNRPYPYIPGTYFLTVTTINDGSYDARSKVLTKRIDEDQHTKMIDDIEGFIKGLSLTISSKRNLLNDISINVFGRNKAEKYAYILANKDKIVAGLEEISKNRRYSVTKTYPVIPKYKARKIDHKSMKFLMTHPEQQKTIQAPLSTITYDIRENVWLKSIIEILLVHVNDMKKVCLKFISYANNSTQLMQFQKEIQSLQYSLTSFLSEKWIAELPRNQSKQVPLSLIRIGSYNVFYRIYRVLKGKTEEIKVNSSLQFHHKRSDLLYEIWGYLKVVSILKKNHGFTITKNWFQKNQNSLDKIIVTNQSKSDFIELQKENKVIRVYFDEQIPKKKEHVSRENTLYTLNNNRPDCRVDVWIDEQYKGSLIIDFKYRKKQYLWQDEHLNDDQNPTKVMKQLESYANGMRTNSSALNGHESIIVDAKPVIEVWAVYPRRFDDQFTDYTLNDYNIRLIDLTPGRETEQFEVILEEVIARLVSR